jgi:hypothetical protein
VLEFAHASVALYAFWGLAAATWGTPAFADPTSPAGTLPPWAYPFPHLALELPVLKPLNFAITATNVPSYEILRLPTYAATATLFSSERLSLGAFTRVAPALELDCSTLCRPVLEQAVGASAEYSLGAVSPQVPATWLFLNAARVQNASTARGPGTAPRVSSRVHGGIAGLLDF